MKVYQAMANAFVKEGTTTVFGLLGDAQLPWWAAMSMHPGVSIVDARHEGAALTMAEGWARITGRVGVCSVTQGPGVSHLASSLITATRSHTPVVIYTSQTTFNDGHALQYLDTERFVNVTGAGCIEVLTPSFAESAVRQAFYRARLEQRPVLLCVPRDVQSAQCDSDAENYVPSSAMFSGQQRIRPDVDQLNAAVGVLARSKRPVIVIGRCANKPEVLAAIDRIGGRIGALLATSLPAKGALGENEYHAGIAGLFATRNAMQLFHEADCVLAFGASLNPHTLENGYLFPPEAKIIHVDIAPHVMMGNDKGADIYIQGDAGASANAIEEMLAQGNVTQTGYRTPAVRKSLVEAGRDTAEYDIAPGTVDPREVVQVMDERLPADIGIASGGGHAFAFPVQGMRKVRPLHMFVTSFGCIGQTLSAAIGASVALQGKPLVHISGDGGTMQNIQELDTLARLGTKLLVAVLNDEALGAEYQKIKAHGGNMDIAAVRSPDFAAVGRAFGLRGRKATTLDEVAAGVDEFLAGDGPMVLDIRISRNVLSIPYRRMYFGQDV